MIRFSCTHCGKAFAVENRMAGKKAKCGKCGNELRVPNSPGGSDVPQSGKGIAPSAPPAPRSVPSETDGSQRDHHGAAAATIDTNAEWVDARQNIVGSIDVKALKSEFTSIQWQALFPIRTWIDDRPWSLVWVQYLVFAFCFPLMLIHYFGNQNVPLAEAAWALSLYFAVIWAVFLQRCMRPESLKRRTFLGTWLFTSVLGVLAVVLVSAIGQNLPVIGDLFTLTPTASVFGRIVGFTLAVGLVEEAAKALPVAWFAARSSPRLRPVTVAYIGVISGLAFGATEAIVYSFQYRLGLELNAMSHGGFLIVQILRFISLPLLHAVWSAILGYFIGLAVLTPHTRRALILLGLILVAMLHGLYDAFADSWLGLLIATASLFLFIGYVRVDVHALSQSPAEPSPTTAAPDGATAIADGAIA